MPLIRPGFVVRGSGSHPAREEDFVVHRSSAKRSHSSLWSGSRSRSDTRPSSTPCPPSKGALHSFSSAGSSELEESDSPPIMRNRLPLPRRIILMLPSEAALAGNVHGHTAGTELLCPQVIIHGGTGTALSPEVCSPSFSSDRSDSSHTSPSFSESDTRRHRHRSKSHRNRAKRSGYRKHSRLQLRSYSLSCFSITCTRFPSPKEDTARWIHQFW